MDIEHPKYANPKKMNQHINRLYYNDNAVVYNKTSSLYSGYSSGRKRRTKSKPLTTKVLINLYGNRAHLITEQKEKSRASRLGRPHSANML